MEYCRLNEGEILLHEKLIIGNYACRKGSVTTDEQESK